jgi:hypothetical protein
MWPSPHPLKKNKKNGCGHFSSPSRKNSKNGCGHYSFFFFLNESLCFFFLKLVRAVAISPSSKEEKEEWRWPSPRPLEEEQ